MVHLPKNDVNLLVVSLLGGVRYYLGGANGGLFLAAEGGLNWGRASVDTGAGTVSDSNTELGATLTAGLAVSGIDLRGGLQIYDIGEPDDSTSLLITAGLPLTVL